MKAALERFWRPQLEKRLLAVFSGQQQGYSTSDQLSTASASATLLSALAMLSKSIVQLGPALAGPELAQQARSILEGIRAHNAIAVNDAKALEALLACDAAGLSNHIAADISLHRIRLAISPLLWHLLPQQQQAMKRRSR